MAPGAARGAALGRTWLVAWLCRLAAPAGMAVGLIYGGVWMMLAAGAVGALIGGSLALWKLTAREARARQAREIPAPAALRRYAREAGLGEPRLYVIPAAQIYTTSWLHKSPVLFVGESWMMGGELHPHAMGAAVHELAHVKRRDVLRSNAIKTAALYLVSLSLISPVGALLPGLFRNLSLVELGMVVTFPLASWLAATQVSSQLRKLELRADALAAQWCGPEALETSLRMVAGHRPVRLFSPHPPLSERLRALRR